MALGALISAYQDASGEGTGAGLRATLPLAGRTLVEYQARLARAAGAQPIVILVERMPPALLAAVDRLTTEGIAVQLARGIDEAAGYFEAGDAVLFIAGGLFADAASVERMAAATSPSIMTMADNIGMDAFERIDASSRWAGLATASGAQIASTAAMLGDWDLQSTLLRRMVQDGARQMSTGAPTQEGAPPMLLMATGNRDLDDAERRIVAGARGTRGDWVERYVTPILEEFAVERLMGTAVRPQWLVAGALGLTALAAFFFAQGWLGAAVIALVMSVPLDGIGERLAALRMQPLGRGDRLRRGLPLVAGAAYAFCALWLADHVSGWGAIVTAATGLTAFFAAARERPPGPPASPWLASRKGAILLAVPFAATGAWTWGLGAIALHATASFLWLQHRAHSSMSSRD